MNQIVHRTSAVATKRPDAEYAPASGDIRALISAKREGYLWRTDLTPDRIAAVRQQLAAAEAAALPCPLLGVKTWLGRLAQFVTNPPEPAARSAQAAIFAEVCSDIPVGAWTPETRIAWTRQPDRNGYPVGSRWPAPGELYAHLRPYAEQIRSEVTGLREILAIAEKPSEPERKRPDASELARAGALADAVIRELKAAAGEGLNP
ncbi:hypothetical protein [Gluconobacter oxydans]|uniref:hypothetical protein n=1 Tax=Gluconobacter oxydans TaxID=442 RepID=UPI0039EAD962